jgi:CBS domain-containing protein
MDEQSIGRERVDRFLTAFNAIEGALRRALRSHKNVGFRELARDFARRNSWWRTAQESLGPIADIRNFLVHETVEPNIYAAVPSLEVIEVIEGIRDELLKPTTVFDRYQKPVLEFTPETPLAEVLRVIAETGITYFPVRPIFDSDWSQARGVMRVGRVKLDCGLAKRELS